MKTTIAILLAIGLLAGLAASEPAPYQECEGAAGISCSAYASLSIFTTGGTCKGTAKADCTALGDSQSTYVEAYEEWWGGGEDLARLCDSETITAAANAVAEAIAEVWVSAKAQVSCDGYGTACGYSFTNGQAYAISIAEALAQAAAEVVVGSKADAFCYTDVRAVSTAIAEATATADAEACVTDAGTNEDWKEAYVLTLATAIADAFASASVAACADYAGEVSASSQCDGESTSTTEEEILGVGDVCGGVSQVYECKGKVKEECCGSGRGICKCSDCEKPWRKISKPGDAKVVYENQGSKAKCFCL